MNRNEVEELDVDPKIIEAAKKAKLFTFKQVLMLSLRELVKGTGLSERYAGYLQMEAAKASLNSSFVTCLQLQRGDCPENLRRSRLSLGCPVLNRTLKGGILTGTLTEITGESASGKTQLCLQLSIQAQLSAEYGGLSGKVAYICTEDKFPYKRLSSITTNLEKKHPQFKSISFANNIFINQVKSLTQMFSCLKSDIPNLIKNGVKLIIIDSVAALFRSDYKANEYLMRAQDLKKFSIEIWKIANEYGIAVICVNQVSSNISKKKQGYCALDNNLIPTLGLLWANVITTRLALSRTNRVNPSPSRSYPLVVRSLKVIFSSYLPRTCCFFVVTENGVAGLKN